MKKLIYFLLLILLPFIGFGQMVKQTVKYAPTKYYNVYMPTKYRPVGTILYLHGLGERGNTIEGINGPNGPEKNELPKLFKEGYEMPYIVIVPQLNPGRTDWLDEDLYPFFAIMEGYGLPKHVTGLSLGGRGVYRELRLARDFNGGKGGYFTTAVPICGNTTGFNPNIYRGQFMKIYHGALDTQIKPDNDKTLVKALQPVMGDSLEFRLYPDKGHEIWSIAYNKDSLDTDSYEAFLRKHEPAKVIQDNIKGMTILNGTLYIETESKKKYVGKLQEVK